MIEAKNLTKRFGSLMAVDHINAQIRDGSVFGLIGTNGAGKSTFLRMLSGVLKPDEGSVTIDGKKYTAHAGDVLFVPSGSKVIWGSPDKARILYATYPANWADLT